MARKEPFRTIAVRRRILDALEPRREKESAARLRPYSVNEFCEAILWDFAQGKLSRVGSAQAGGMGEDVAGTSGGVHEYPSVPSGLDLVADQLRKDDRKKTHPRRAR